MRYLYTVRWRRLSWDKATQKLFRTEAAAMRFYYTLVMEPPFRGLTPVEYVVLEREPLGYPETWREEVEEWL